MPHPRLSDVEIDRRGQEMYERYIRSKVETAENIGKQIVIDVETGDYEIDSDGLAASRRLLAKHPDAALFGARIGYDAVYALGAGQAHLKLAWVFLYGDRVICNQNPFVPRGCTLWVCSKRHHFRIILPR